MIRGASLRLLRMRTSGAVAGLMLLGLLAGCGKADSDKKSAQSVPVELKSTETLPANSEALQGVTPMAERVAVLGLLNKRNGLVQELTIKPGESQRAGNVIVRLRACEQTAPWENYPETGAFVQLVVLNRGDQKWYRVFSGWLFRERPERNVIQHPIYDVFVKSCAMTYPGGEAVAPPSAGLAGEAGKADASASSAAQSPAANGGAGGSGSAQDGASASVAAAPAPAALSPAAPESTE